MNSYQHDRNLESLISWHPNKDGTVFIFRFASRVKATGISVNGLNLRFIQSLIATL